MNQTLQAEGGSPAWYRWILSVPDRADREYIRNGCTYGEIYQLAAAVRRLSDISDISGQSLCVCTENRALLMAALLSALAGGPRVVLPYALSPQALVEVDEALHPTCYLTDTTDNALFPAGSQVVVPAQLSTETGLPVTPIEPDAPFLVLFTGGSTGTPKIWSKTPRNMFAEVQYQIAQLGFTQDDIVLPTVPPCHIYGLLFSVLAPFLSGAAVLDGTYLYPREIIRAAREFRATVLVSVPAHYRVLKSEDLERFDLRMALSSAGTLEREDSEYFFKKTGLSILEIFGSTETGGIAVRQRTRSGESWIPMDPIAWKIRNERLCVRSDFLSPTLPRNAEGYFATADLVEADGDGRFLLRGRADSIVKIGGKRVDLNDVLSKLKRIAGIRDAYVLAIGVGKGRRNEVAAVVSTGLTAQQVRRELALTCEAYAVPKRLVVTDGIPMTPTGKYDRTEIEKILKAND